MAPIEDIPFSLNLAEAELALVRQLLFEELAGASKALAQQAEAAADGAVDPDGAFAGDNANATWRHRVQVLVDLLDRVGWSVVSDADAIVASERRRSLGRGGDA